MSSTRCKNCGAEFDNSLLTCPYCDAENTAEAHRRQKEYVEDYKRKASFWSKLPEWIVGKTGSAMRKIAILGVGVFVLILLIGFVAAKIYSATGVWRMDMEVAKLERYYVQGDYEGLKEYFWSLDSTYGGSYEKYDRTVNMYLNTTWAIRDLESLADGNHIQYYTVEDVEDIVEGVIDTMYELQSLENEGFSYDEGAAMLEFKGWLEAAIEEHLPLTEVEYEDAYSRYVENEENNYSVEAEWIMERLMEDVEREM